MKKLFARISSIGMAFGLLCGGCASITTLSTSPKDPKTQSYQHAREVYGGTKLDKELLNSGGALFPLIDIVRHTIFLIDLPMSMVVDTVALPFTVPYNANRGGIQKSPEPGAAPAAAGASSVEH